LPRCETQIKLNLGHVLDPKLRKKISFFFFFFFFWFFETGFLCVALACPGTHFVDQAGLELRNPPASASGVLGLKACATTPSKDLLDRDSALKSISCSSRGPGFNSQNPHGNSQLSVTPVPRNPTPSYRRSCVCVCVCVCAYIVKTPIYIHILVHAIGTSGL
jgi:hypothetical protein